jgi:hypothetical protein
VIKADEPWCSAVEIVDSSRSILQEGRFGSELCSVSSTRLFDHIHRAMFSDLLGKYCSLLSHSAAVMLVD